MSIGYLIQFKPHKSKVHMLKDVMTELSFMIIFASSFPLLDIDVSIEA